jgi:hypothetical protein
MEDLKVHPTYEYATLTHEQIEALTNEQIGAIRSVKSEDLKSLNSGLNGLTTADLSSLSVAPLSTQTIDTLQTISLTGSVSQGYTLASATGSNLVWSSQTPYYTSSAIGGVTGATISAASGKQGQLSLTGDNADIVVNGKSLMSMLERIEERLNLLEPNTNLEADWDELRELGERYRELEKRCKEKAEVWKKLKDLPPPRVD